MITGVQNTQNIAMPWVHAFLYGASGSGKTTAAATFPNPLFVVPRHEGSMTTLMGRDISYILIDDMNGMTNLLNELINEYNANPDKFPYDTIVIESVTHYCDIIIKDLTNNGRFVMDQSRWGTLGNHLLRDIQMRLRSIDVNAVFTALDTRAGRDNEAAGQPMIQGQSSTKLPSSCDITGYCEVSGGKHPRYRTHFVQHGTFIARTRFESMPKIVENFNYAEHVEPYILSGRSSSKPKQKEESNGEKTISKN